MEKKHSHSPEVVASAKLMGRIDEVLQGQQIDVAMNALCGALAGVAAQSGIKREELTAGVARYFTYALDRQLRADNDS